MMTQTFAGKLSVARAVFLLLMGTGMLSCDSAMDAARVQSAVLLSINDVYLLTGPDRGAGGGGLARVRALRNRLEKTHPDLLMLHAGDFLSPSLLERKYRGSQMIDLMNLLDGDPRRGSFDRRMFVAFGNHEFDRTDCRKKGPLADRIRESDFTYLASNVDFQKAIQAGSACAGLHEVARLPPGEKILPYKLVTAGGLRLGLYALTIEKDNFKAVMIPSPRRKSCDMVRRLRGLGANAVVALTHLSRKTDLSLLGLGPDGKPMETADCTDYPDVIVGGHDHTRMALPENGDPRIFKADADAVSAYQITITIGESRKVSVRGVLHELGRTADSDAAALSRAAQWFSRHDRLFCQESCSRLTGQTVAQCAQTVRDGSCLREEIAMLASPLVAEEIKNRTRETGFGDWFMDRIRDASGAQVALFNAGAIRLNYDIEAGRPVTRRHLAEMFPYSNRFVVADVPAAQLWKAMAHSFATSGAGSWLHFSGLAAERHEDGTLKRLVLLTDAGKGQALTSQSRETVRVASIAFVLANKDKHGFRLCEPNTIDCIVKKFAGRWPATLSHDSTQLVDQFMRRDGSKSGLVFEVDGRICTTGQTSCLTRRLQVSN